MSEYEDCVRNVRMTSSDKDFRFMATNDLMVELQKDSIKLDDDSERKVVKMLLKLLEDKNGEVQNLAVKCLGPLVTKVKEFQVEVIVDNLCTNMVSDKEQLRDISVLVSLELPPSATTLAASICKKITGRLTNAIAKQEDVSVQLEALDILGDLLSRFCGNATVEGGLLVSFHNNIRQALLPQLASPRLAVRKRAIIAIGYLVMSCNTVLFQELIDFLLTELMANTSTSTSTTRTYIQCVGAINRQAGHRFGEHLQSIVPLVVKYCQMEDDELREYCLQAFESFVRRCPKEVSPFIKEIIAICLKYICHDPNYNYDDDEEAMDTEADEEEEEESDDEYSNDDDMSWKVRRSAAKCIEAVISTRHEMLAELYRTVSPALIARFKEREENVKSDIFNAYVSLLRQTRPVATSSSDCMETEKGPVLMLQSQIGDIVKAIHKQLREKSIKTRQGCFSLLTELVLVLPGALSNHFGVLVPGIQYSLGDKNSSSNMKIDTLSFLNTLLMHHSPAVFHPHMKVLVPPIVNAVGDPFYKITSEALLVTQQLVKVIRPFDEAQKSVFEYQGYVKDLYSCTLRRLKAADIDQEVKERAISCMGQIVSHLGDSLQTELSECLPLFLERLKNEITRLTTVKALTMIASMINDMMKEMPPLISENDLHVSQLTLNLFTSLCDISKANMASISSEILPQCFLLVQSPLLQGGALQALLEFLQSIVRLGLNKLGFRDLLQEAHLTLQSEMLMEPTLKMLSFGDNEVALNVEST
ncbi:Cullin-associated NEDD8-dissociated protein 1 [Nucella lapillus]